MIAVLLKRRYLVVQAFSPLSQNLLLWVSNFLISVCHDFVVLSCGKIDVEGFIHCVLDEKVVGGEVPKRKIDIQVFDGSLSLGETVSVAYYV